jgi:DNA-directed RNA polymerase subunit RPC12/RpoP
MADDTAARLAAAEAELDRLRRQVDELSAQLGAGRQHEDRSMRGRLRCSACGHRRLLHASEVLDRGDADSREKMALVKPSVWRSRVLGQFEVYLCAHCGLVEWYVKDVAQLVAQLASLRGVVRLIDSPAPDADGPYR